MTGYKMNYNQDFTSISVLSKTGFRLYTISSVDSVDEIYSKENENIRIVERLFNSSLMVLVTENKPNCLKMLHFKKKLEICNCVYPSTILCVRMNKCRLVVCLAESIHIHDIQDMKILKSIENISLNELGLCTLSLNSHLAYPVSGTSGELQIFKANELKEGLTIQAHKTLLSAICFSPTGMLIATASERGTVIRVFCVKNGQRVQEFRRGMKRYVRIESLVFSAHADFLCVSSNKETIHIFKIDTKEVSLAEHRPVLEIKAVNNPTLEDISTTNNTEIDSWSGYLTKTISTYFPSQVSNVLNQNRAFSTAVLSQPGLKHICGLTKFGKEIKLMVACEDGFLYIYDFSNAIGGSCKLIRAHDLRNTLEGVIELNFTESPNKSTPIIIENNERQKDSSYAGILKGDYENGLTESAKCRSLCDAINSPAKLYDEMQFPPVKPTIRD
ncbi:WD repeat domain phosphoinositide-interacting protein 1 isoform X2 [Episyrphus balteatus]|uniref:WD repeat domain phosphoinositide-interacting protein 1 isoform X2 n=1 Tax=Episyrphus balteatus TaxID=286459 RepID=UPI0024866489|nr:WD repeat domain phosphoinositide-interacting protein 1 isoform X2 [Episyrphus balteatus]